MTPFEAPPADAVCCARSAERLAALPVLPPALRRRVAAISARTPHWIRRPVAVLRRTPTHLLIGLFSLWRLAVSPLYGQTCKYHPSCSAYGLESVRRYGATRGLLLTGWRLMRCNPWSSGGVDDVPAITHESRKSHSAPAESTIGTVDRAPRLTTDDLAPTGRAA